jgi:hypothetical protein
MEKEVKKVKVLIQKKGRKYVARVENATDTITASKYELALILAVGFEAEINITKSISAIELIIYSNE